MPSKTVSTDDSTWEKVTNAKPYTSAEEITIENYVEKYFETSYLVINLCLQDQQTNRETFNEKILNEINKELENISAIAYIYYMDNSTMTHCLDYVKKNAYDTQISIGSFYRSKSTYYFSYNRQQNTNYDWVLRKALN